MNKADFLKQIAETAYNIGFGAKKHFATYDIVEKTPGFIAFFSMSAGIFGLVFECLSAKWVSAFFLMAGITGFYIERNKQVAEQLLQELITEEERAQFGAVSRDIKHYAAIPLEQHLQDFLSVVKSWGRSPKHLYCLSFHCRQIISFCGWKYPQDIKLFDFEKWRSASKRSAKTKNHYLGALREFCRWMVLHNRMMVDPMNHAQKLDLRRVQKNHRRVPGHEARYFFCLTTSPFCNRNRGKTGE